jgi:TolA-binding protein
MPAGHTKRFLSDYGGHWLEREVRYALGWTYIELEEYARAAEAFEPLAAGDDEIAQAASLRLGLSLKHAGERGRAAEVLRESASRFPESRYAAESLYELGMLHYENREYGEARDAFEAVTTRYSGSAVTPQATRMLGETFVALEEYQSARTAFAAVVVMENVPARIRSEALYQEGWVLFRMRQFNQAVQKLEQFLTEYPDHPRSVDAGFWAGESHYQLENYRGASARYQQVVAAGAQHPRHRQGLYGFAWANLRQQRFDDAARAFDEFVRRYPRSEYIVDARLRLADCYMALGRYQEAIAGYRTVVQNHPDAAEIDYAEFQLGQALFRAGNREQARTEFRRFVQNKPNSDLAPEAQYAVGWTYFQTQDYDRAIEEFRRTIELFPGTVIVPRAHYSIGDAHYNKREYDEAIRAYRQVLERHPRSQYVPDAITGIQYSYTMQDNIHGAIGVIDDFLRQNPESEMADQLMFKKGDLYFSEQRFREAITEWRAFVNRYGGSSLVPEAHYWIGRASLMVGNDNDAMQAFNTVINNHGGSAAAPKALLEIGNAHLGRQAYAEAISAFDRLAERYGDSEAAMEGAYGKGLALEDMGRGGDARAQYERVRSTHEGTRFAALSAIGVARIMNGEGDTAGAIQLLRGIVTARTDEVGAEAQYMIGSIELERENYQDAITQLLRVRYVFPSASDWVARSYIGLGEAYEATNQTARAREAYETVIRQHSETEYAREAETKLRRLGRS